MNDLVKLSSIFPSASQNPVWDVNLKMQSSRYRPVLPLVQQTRKSLENILEFQISGGEIVAFHQSVTPERNTLLLHQAVIIPQDKVDLLTPVSASV